MLLTNIPESISQEPAPIDRTGQYMPANKMPLTLSQAHEVIAKACRADIGFYGKFVFGYDMAPHHREWLTAVLSGDTDKLMIISPRESAKTTWMCVILLTWYIGHFPYKTNAILSVTEDQAIQRLMVIRDTIQNNPRYHLVFPWVKPDYNKQWTTTAMNVWDNRPRNPEIPEWGYGNYKAWLAQSGESPKDHTLRAAGALSGQVIGNRYSGIVLLDDIHDEKNVNTRETIDKVDTWFHRTLLPCARPGSKFLIIGTRWAPEDLLGRLSEKKIEHRDSETGTITYKNMWKMISTKALIENQDGTYSSYWPENWPVSRLLETRDSVGDVIFELMYQNNPYAMSGDLFNDKWLEQGLPLKLPKFKGIYIGVDLAFTKNTRSDFTAIVILGLSEDFRMYNLAMHIGKYDKNQLTEKLYLAAEQAREYGNLEQIFIEQVGAGAMIVDQLIQELPLPITGVPVANKGDKVARAQGFSVLCAKGHYYCNWTSTEGRRHKGELLSFPTGPKDDTVDAVSLVVNSVLNFNISRAKVHRIKPKILI